MGVMQRRHYEELALCVRAVLDEHGGAMYFRKLARELEKCNPNMNFERFCDAAGL